MANLLLPLSVGARVVFLETVNTTELLRALDERGVTIFACVPQFFYLIHQRVTAEVAQPRRRRARGCSEPCWRLNGRLRGARASTWAAVLFRQRPRRRWAAACGCMVTGGSKFDPADRARTCTPGVQHPPGVRPHGDVGRRHADAAGRPAPRDRRTRRCLASTSGSRLRKPTTSARPTARC